MVNSISARRFKEIWVGILWGYALALLVYLALRFALGDGVWWLAWLNNFGPYYFLPLWLTFPLALWTGKPRLRMAHLMLWVIGVLWLLPRFISFNAASLNAQSETQPPLRVVTFNVWGDNPNLERVVAWLRETNADIILLQEIPPIWAGQAISQLADLYPYQVSQPLELRVWGDTILSQHPIRLHERYALDGDFEANERIEIEWAGQTIAIYNAHLTMPQRETPHLTLPINYPFLNMLLKYDDTIRNNQIDRLLQRLASEPHPFIVGGDFNLSDNAVKYEVLAASLKDAYRESASGIGATWPNAPVAGLPSLVPPLLRIDYVWHSHGWQSVEAYVGPELGSDHFPLVVTLGLSR